MNIEGNKENLQEAIVRTIAFFDLFDYPLTVWEIWKYLGVKCELSEVMKVLSDELPSNVISTGGRNPLNESNQHLRDFSLALEMTKGSGFFFLNGREKIIDVRKKRFNYAQRKLKRAKLIAKIFKIIPWIKLIAVGNLIGSYNLRDQSDIDLFIVTAKNRTWLTRFWCVVITKFLNLRPTSKNSRDKICLSFFVSENNLSLENLMLPSQDPYFVYWFAGLYPIYNTNSFWQKLYQGNKWLENYLPNFQPGIFNSRYNAGHPWPKFYRKVIDIIFGRMENLSKKIQLKYLAPDLKKIMNQDTRVVINEQILKLHANDRRKEYLDKFNKNFDIIVGRQRRE